MRCAAVTRDGAADTLDGRQCVAEALHGLVRAPVTWGGGGDAVSGRDAGRPAVC
jgi:hypothetical protein